LREFVLGVLGLGFQEIPHILYSLDDSGFSSFAHGCTLSYRMT